MKRCLWDASVTFNCGFFLLFLVLWLHETVAGFLARARLHRYAKHCGQVLPNENPATFTRDWTFLCVLVSQAWYSRRVVKRNWAYV